MAAHNLAVAMGLPSPTLTNPDLILPESTTRSFSPNPYAHAQRPPSPSSLLYYSNPPVQTVKLASAPPGRRGLKPRTMSPPITARSSVSTLPNIAEAEATPRMRSQREDVLASSPTIRDSYSGTENMDSWDAYKSRRLSNASSSVHSEDLEAMKWPGFDGGGAFDDSGVVLDEDDEHQGDIPKTANGDEELDNDPWSDEHDENDDDPYSSAALSRRAEIILANAKKRLNVMEGNLRGARSSLLVTPVSSSFNPVKMASELSQQLSAARDRDRQLYGGLGFIPPRQRPYHSSPLSTSGSPRHSRVFSETSVPSPISARGANKTNDSDRRSSSALGPTSGPWSPIDGYYGGHASIRETKSQEVMRDHRNGWSNHDRDHSLRKHSWDSRASPSSLEPLPEAEDEMPKLHRSASTTSDLRVQMNELKGKISTLKQRAREDGLRRRSLQSLRTPSPFTAAETWYSGADGYKTGSPIQADAGVGCKEDNTASRELYDEDTNTSSTPKTMPSDPHLDVQAVPQKAIEGESHSEYQESNYEDAEESPADYNGFEDDQDDLDEIGFVSVDNDAETIYEDAAYEAPVTERHEDRIDAFDYEHFFLHSAMGTYSSGSRRSSPSSAGSVDSAETTRPVTAFMEGLDLQATPRQSRPGGLHQRNASVDSISTMATFATATEGNGSDDGSDDEANERLDEFSQHVLAQPVQRIGVHHGDRPESAINFSAPRGSQYAKESPDLSSQNSRVSSPGADIVGGLRASKIFSILLEPSSTEDRRLSLNEHEKQLIYGLAASLQQVCANLQSTDGDQYERKAWRRRLDDARRLLDGEDNDAF